MRGRYIKLYEEDQDLLEDVLIEIKQAIEMSSIYLNILSGTMDAFASVISNNLNIVMKVLASVTIVISIPNIIAGFYGMNVDGLPLNQFWWFPIVVRPRTDGRRHLVSTTKKICCKTRTGKCPPRFSLSKKEAFCSGEAPFSFV